LIIVWISTARCNLINKSFNYLTANRWPRELYFLKYVPIGLKDSFKTNAFRVKDIAICGKAIRDLVIVGRYLCTKPVEWNLLVLIIELDDLSYCLDRLQILVLL
jgi:hypothetical protein